MDYTSAPNIMKVIRPLFLDELEDAFEKILESEILATTKIDRLKNLWARISQIKIFDPACGSGNFLIITYKKLRELESQIIEELNELTPAGIQDGLTSQIQLKNFYGIEIDDFAHELAVLSLYIAAHQMNIEFEKEFGKKISIIPLQDNPKIVCGNAARLDWNEVCPNVPHKSANHKAEQAQLIELEPLAPEQQELLPDELIYDEIYVIGNPPYKGAKLQSKDQKADFTHYFKDEKYSKNLDYIAIWFIKGARYISKSIAKLAFVSTNSVSQGEHVSAMFPKIFDEEVEIGFAYTSFKWKNNAKDNAGVTVVVIGLAPKEIIREKFIFPEKHNSISVENINGYLLGSATNTSIEKATSSISGFANMIFGSQSLDGGGLLLSPENRNLILSSNPEAGKFIKKVIGGKEMISGLDRYCLFIPDAEQFEARSIPEIKKRLDFVAEFRAKAQSAPTRQKSSTPHKFGSIRYNQKPSLVIPRTSSEGRDYIPMSLISADTIVLESAQFIEDAPLWLFALLNSKIHMAWIRTVCGQLETRIRYSSTLGYNTFPVPPLTPEFKQRLEDSAKEILFARENHTEKTLAQMYDPACMPADLREAHRANDLLVDSIYQPQPFENDEQRLTKLFELYEQMTKEKK